MSQPKIPLDKLIMGGVEATIEEKYEVLQKMAEAMTASEKDLFFQIVNIIAQPLLKQKTKNGKD